MAVTVVQDHHYQCSRFMLACPNRCDAGKVAREEMTTHLSQFCPAAVIPCKFREIGCKHVVSLSDLRFYVSNRYRVVHKKESHRVSITSSDVDRFSNYFTGTFHQQYVSK